MHIYKQDISKIWICKTNLHAIITSIWNTHEWLTGFHSANLCDVYYLQRTNKSKRRYKCFNAIFGKKVPFFLTSLSASCAALQVYFYKKKFWLKQTEWKYMSSVIWSDCTHHKWYINFATKQAPISV